MWNVSQSKSNLIDLSRGESVPKLDKWLHSISQGFSLASIMMSRPKIWKHCEFSKSSVKQLR